MGQIQYTIRDYGFKKPRILYESEYQSFKVLYQTNPDFDIEPKMSFWKEFKIVIWLAVAIVVGMPLAIANEVFSFIPGLAIAGLVFVLIFNAQSMMNYRDFLNAKNNYYRGLKIAITTSYNYAEFKNKASML